MTTPPERPVRTCVACTAGLTAHVPDDGQCLHRHEQVLLTSPDGTLVNVDVGVADFVQSLWAAGVNTFASCEGPEFAYVSVLPPTSGDVRLCTLGCNDGDRRRMGARGRLTRVADEISPAERAVRDMPVVLPNDVLELLREIRGDQTARELEAAAERNRNSPDLNEAYLSGLALVADEILRKYGH